MKLDELLTESSNGEILDKAISLIKKDCGPFLKEMPNTPLLRSMKSSSSMVKDLSGDEWNEGVFLRGSVRNDRKARDSVKWLHDALNDMFIREVGIPVRSASLFTSFTKEVVNYYRDDIYTIFPIGEFHYAWSADIHDPTVTFQNHWGRFQNKTVEKYVDEAIDALKIKPQNTDLHRSKIVNWVLTKYGSTLYHFDEGLKKAEGFPTEIMVVCDRYYAVSQKFVLKTTSMEDFIKACKS